MQIMVGIFSKLVAVLKPSKSASIPQTFVTESNTANPGGTAVPNTTSPIMTTAGNAADIPPHNNSVNEQTPKEAGGAGSDEIHGNPIRELVQKIQTEDQQEGEIKVIQNRGRRITLKATGKKGFGKWKIVKNEPSE